MATSGRFLSVLVSSPFWLFRQNTAGQTPNNRVFPESTVDVLGRTASVGTTKKRGRKQSPKRETQKWGSEAVQQKSSASCGLCNSNNAQLAQAHS